MCGYGTNGCLLGGAEEAVDKAGHDAGVEAVLEGQPSQRHVADTLRNHRQGRRQACTGKCSNIRKGRARKSAFRKV